MRPLVFLWLAIALMLTAAIRGDRDAHAPDPLWALPLQFAFSLLWPISLAMWLWDELLERISRE